ncbi:GNAT family N-acetyltransferase [Paenibacillus alkalitolerans]|uniref:GNAT family N-acetyltransferase n=1 Tax=Paenibacillus alkalitolerans TaxID=2799335 RepID=UPI0018F516C3|nr:GNAT family N-acetyltransferase [Paenibacillus alkalitolerans]
MEIRMLSDKEMEEAAKLSDRTFRDAEQTSMAVAFPYIFSGGVKHLSFGAFDQGKLASFFGLVPWTVCVGEARLRAFSIGSVCTDPAYRGHGIASQVLEEIFAYLNRTEASLLFVSGTRSLYTRVDCCRFGRVRKYTVDGQAAAALSAEHASADAVTVREADVSDIFALHELSHSQNVRFESDVNGLAALIKAEAVAGIEKARQKVFVAETAEGGVQAFAVVGAKDQRAVVYEWAGKAELVAGLAGKCHSLLGGTDTLVMRVGWHETAIHQLMSGVGYEEEDNEGTVKIVNMDALLKQLKPWLSAENATVPVADIAKSLTPEQLVAFIFDRASGGVELPEQARNNWKPVPLPFTGGVFFI